MKQYVQSCLLFKVHCKDIFGSLAQFLVLNFIFQVQWKFHKCQISLLNLY
jgi:hypothetical protein